MKATLETLARRQLAIDTVRDYFRRNDFLELQAPCLVRGTCPDPFIHSFALDDTRYLTTSTEYHIKRLMAAGAPRVYTLQSNFREGDIGRAHNPEFTMIEWGRAGATMRDIETDLETMVATVALQLSGVATAPSPRGPIDLSLPYPRLSVTEALRRYLGVALERFDAASLYAAAVHVGETVNETWADDATALFSLLVDRLQDHLGWDRPTWLVDWPAYLGSSVATTERGTVDRSELFIAGIEVSDGFPFVSDATGQRQRFERANALRLANDIAPVSFDERYLSDLPKLPHGAGMAAGFDRLLMAVLGKRDIAEVIAYPWNEL